MPPGQKNRNHLSKLRRSHRHIRSSIYRRPTLPHTCNRSDHQDQNVTAPLCYHNENDNDNDKSIVICDITSISTLEQCGWEHGKSKASVRYAYTSNKKRNQRPAPNVIAEGQSETSDIAIAEENTSTFDENISAEIEADVVTNRRMSGSSTGTSTTTGLEQEQERNNMRNIDFECRHETIHTEKLKNLRNADEVHQHYRIDINVQGDERQSDVEDSEDVEITFVTSCEDQCDVTVRSDGRNMDAGEKVSVDVCSPSNPGTWKPQGGPSVLRTIRNEALVEHEESTKPSPEENAVVMRQTEVYSYTSLDMLVRNNWAYEPCDHGVPNKIVYATSNSNDRDKLFGFD